MTRRTIPELDARPGRRGALDRTAQIHGADAGAVTLGDEIADRLLMPGRIDDAAIERGAELQVGQRRRRSEREQQRDGDRNADASSGLSNGPRCARCPRRPQATPACAERRRERPARAVSLIGGMTSIAPLRHRAARGIPLASGRWSPASAGPARSGRTRRDRRPRTTGAPGITLR